MIMKEYKKPEMEVVELEKEDIILTSDCNPVNVCGTYEACLGYECTAVN